MTTCILLSAGLSSRFGSPKALAKINDQFIIEILQNRLIDSQVGEIIIVLGAQSNNIQPYLLNHKKVKVVYNKDYKLGQTSSFQAGLKFVSQGSQGVLLLPVDFPCIRQSTIDQIVAHFGTEGSKILIPTYEGKKGHPPVFHPDLITEFLNLEVSQGINAIAHKHESDVILLPVEDPGVCLTFNTQEELAQLT